MKIETIRRIAGLCTAALPMYVMAGGSLNITTWNLRHMMSESTFQEWANFCGKYKYMWNEDEDEDEVKASGAQKPSHLTYCNAYNGLHYPSKSIRESKQIETLLDFRIKRDTLRTKLGTLDSDVVLLQEVGDGAAVQEVFPTESWDIRRTSAPTAQNIAVAVRRSSAVRIVSAEPIEKLGEVRDQNGRMIRPGQRITVELGGQRIQILNVHLKSGCPKGTIGIAKARLDDPKAKISDVLDACRVLHGQASVLEAWIETQAKAGAFFIVAGDWNRNLGDDRSKKIHMDGTDPTQPILLTTRIGSLFQEIADGEPSGSEAVAAQIQIKARLKTVKCMRPANPS